MTFNISPETIAEAEQIMRDRERPACTAHRRINVGARLVDLPCGCQDVHYNDGTICHEHNHVDCDGPPEET